MVNELHDPAEVDSDSQDQSVGWNNDGDKLDDYQNELTSDDSVGEAEDPAAPVPEQTEPTTSEAPLQANLFEQTEPVSPPPPVAPNDLQVQNRRLQTELVEARQREEGFRRQTAQFEAMQQQAVLEQQAAQFQDSLENQGLDPQQAQQLVARDRAYQNKIYQLQQDIHNVQEEASAKNDVVNNISAEFGVDQTILRRYNDPVMMREKAIDVSRMNKLESEIALLKKGTVPAQRLDSNVSQQSGSPNRNRRIQQYIDGSYVPRSDAEWRELEHQLNA